MFRIETKSNQNVQDCQFEIAALNNDDQTIPIENEFYLNVLADFFLIIEMGIAPPIAYMKDQLEPVKSHMGTPWFWAYAMRYCQNKNENILPMLSAFGPKLDLDLTLEDDLEKLFAEYESLKDCLQVNIIRRERNEHGVEFGIVNIHSEDPKLTEFLKPNLTLETVYGPYTTWECI